MIDGHAATLDGADEVRDFWLTLGASVSTSQQWPQSSWVSGIARKGKRRTGLISTEVTIGDPVPPQFFFGDIDGNRFLIVESGRQ